MKKIINNKITGLNQLDGETITLEEFVKLFKSYPEAIIESVLIPPQPGSKGFGKIYLNNNFPKYMLSIIQK